MPGIEDWINGPIAIVNRLFDGQHDVLQDKVKEYFGHKLQEPNSKSWIPCLNSTAQHELRHNSLVRFRCMIQDMFDPEYYMGVYEVADTQTGNTALHTGMYKDIADCRPGQEIKQDSPKNVTLDRQTFYCVPIPAENEWVKKGFAGVGQQVATASTSTFNRRKRHLEEEIMETSNQLVAASCNGDAGAVTDNKDESKKSKIEEATDKKENKIPNLNFPLPGEKGPACLVKVYETTTNYKVNDTVEFIGILSNDPFMATFSDGENKQSTFADPSDVAMETAELEAHCPPPSLVPRLHVVSASKLQHSNPLLPQDVSQEGGCNSEVKSILHEASCIRAELLGLLKECLFGDALAAEYLLCHLVSSVYARHDVVALGKFTLNLSGLPRNTPYVAKLYHILQQILAKSHLLPLTLDNMNKSRLVPCKDYSANRLVSGKLQLSDRTQLVMDETAMQAGQLDSTGVKNITALGNVIQWQKVEYDFNFHKVDFPTNIICLVLSEGKSLMKCDCRVHLQPQQDNADLDAHFKVIEEKLSSGILTKLRTFLGLMQLLPYELPAELQKEIEEDFVELRKNDPKKLSVDDFHTLLVLGRLLSLSLGKSALTKEVWERAKRMEVQRKVRLVNAPS